MSKFHTFLKNDSSSESEEGELSDNCDNFEQKTDLIQSNPQNLDSKIKTSKSLQIIDKMDTKRNNRFSIWSDLLLEEELNHSVNNSMDIKKRGPKTRKLDRNCENYSFWTKRQFEDNSEKDLIQSNSNLNNNQNNVKNKKKKNKSDKNKQNVKTVDIVIEIAKKLREPKVDLLRKVCKTIGEQKTTELCSATLDIESAGGLMTVDGKRRRTPGGVFFQLLKNDANIPKEKIEIIFSDEQKFFRQKLKKKEKRNNFNKTSKSESIEGQNITVETQSMEK